MTATAPMPHDRWFSSFGRRANAEIRLFCLPHAGAGANVYRAWPAGFGPRIEVTGVCLPGREMRLGEPPAVDPVELATAIAAKADRPYAIFGHSFGARLGFEVIRELRRRGQPLPIHLFPSGAVPPDRRSTGPFDGLSEMDDTRLRDGLVAGGGVPKEVLATPDLLEMFLPALRADFGWLDRYTFEPEPPLPVPITAFAADGDDIAAGADMAGWRRHTTKTFELHTLHGDHFFLQNQLTEIAKVIEPALLTSHTG